MKKKEKADIAATAWLFGAPIAALVLAVAALAGWDGKTSNAEHGGSSLDLRVSTCYGYKVSNCSFNVSRELKVGSCYVGGTGGYVFFERSGGQIHC